MSRPTRTDLERKLKQAQSEALKLQRVNEALSQELRSLECLCDNKDVVIDDLTQELGEWKDCNDDTQEKLERLYAEAGRANERYRRLYDDWERLLDLLGPDARVNIVGTDE